MAGGGRKFPLTRRNSVLGRSKTSSVKERHQRTSEKHKDSVVNGLAKENLHFSKLQDPDRGRRGAEVDHVDGHRNKCDKQAGLAKETKSRHSARSSLGDVYYQTEKMALSPCDTPDMAVSRPDHDSSFTASESDTMSIPLGPSPAKGTETDATIDYPDYNPESLTFSILDCLIYLMSIGTYIADVGSDLWVAALYYRREHYWWCGLTLSFVFVPSLVMGAFSLRWYLIDHRSEMNVSWPRWICRIIFVAFQGALILRYIEVIMFGWRTKKTEEKRKKKEWFKQMIYEDVDSALLRLFEAFMEAAPQLVLQLYIMLRSHGNTDPFMVAVQWLSSGASLGSLAWALAAYHRSLRFSLENKANISYCGVALQFFWRSFTIGARVVALATFASYSPYGVFIVTGIHWILMVVWIRMQESNFCHQKWEEFLFNLVAACVHIFCYFNLVEGHTRLKYLFYYTLVYLENAGMLLAWYLLTQTEDLWYRYPALAVVLGGFFIGIFFQIIYYLKLHPNNFSSDPGHPSIELWVPFSKLSCASYQRPRKKKKKKSSKNGTKIPEKVSTEVKVCGESHVTKILVRETEL